MCIGFNSKLGAAIDYGICQGFLKQKIILLENKKYESFSVH